MDRSIEEIVEVVAPVFGINHDRELTSSPASKYEGLSSATPCKFQRTARGGQRGSQFSTVNE
jgi:hypothetical protein